MGGGNVRIPTALCVSEHRTITPSISPLGRFSPVEAKLLLSWRARGTQERRCCHRIVLGVRLQKTLCAREMPARLRVNLPLVSAHQDFSRCPRHDDDRRGRYDMLRQLLSVSSSSLPSSSVLFIIFVTPVATVVAQTVVGHVHPGQI